MGQVPHGSAKTHFNLKMIMKWRPAAVHRGRANGAEGAALHRMSLKGGDAARATASLRRQYVSHSWKTDIGLIITRQGGIQAAGALVDASPALQS